MPDGHTLSFVARRSAASPATGFYATHQQQEAAILEAAFGALRAADGANGLTVAHAEVRREAGQ